MLIEQFYEHLPHFGFTVDFVRFCNSNIEHFENLFNILTLDKMPDFIEKNKVPFSSVKNVVANRHLHLDFEKNEREKVNSARNFVSRALSEDNSNDSEVAQEIDDSRINLRIIGWRENLLVKMLAIYRKDKYQSQKFCFFQKLILCPHLIG